MQQQVKFCYHCMHQLPNEKNNFCPKCGKSQKPEQLSDRFLKPGTVLGRKFIVGYPLGAGGFGNTYIGWDNLLQRRIAVKEFYPRQYCVRAQDGANVMVTDERLQPRFQRGLQQFLAEARNVAALHDVRGVVQISNFFEENGTGYIVMEYLEGMDVKAILKEAGDKKDYEWSRRVVLTVLYTLREIHKRGVIHRDIAPDNIFVTNEGIIKLIDFGAAKYASALENTGDIMLKKGYAPIEQYSRNLPQGAYTDLYAVAALFYRMLTGQKPIPANERLEQDGLIPPSEMGIQIPQQAEFAIMVCLNIQPEFRLQSADDFMEALEGKHFVPVDEPEWILPAVEEKKGFFGKIASLPMAAKVALCCGGIFIVGGAAFGVVTAIQSTKNTATLDGSTAGVMQDLRNKSLEEAEKYVEKLNIRYPEWEVNLETEDTVFDLTKESGTICSQSIEPGTVLDDDSENREDTISCSLYSNAVIHYHEICELNAYELAKKLGVDTSDEDCFVEKEGTDQNYFELASLKMGGKIFSAQELCKEANQEKEIEYNEDITIYYYATDFFYWKKLPDFAAEYQYIDEVPEQTVYRYVNEKEKEKTGSKDLLESKLVDDSYYALASSGYEVGEIVGQTIAPGEEYDESIPSDQPLEIQVIGEILGYKGKTGEQFVKEIMHCGFGGYSVRTSSGEQGDENWQVADVKIYQLYEDGEITDEEVFCFKPVSDNNRNLYCEIIVAKGDIQNE